jgi:hypothetical protein
MSYFYTFNADGKLRRKGKERKGESVYILSSFVHLLEMEVEFYNFPAS